MTLADTHKSNEVTLHEVQNALHSPENALFSRNGKKTKARKSKALEVVTAARDSELQVVSGSIGTGEVRDDASDDVLDLADQLLQQLDAGAEPDSTLDDLPTPDHSIAASASSSVRSQETAHPIGEHRRRDSLSRKLQHLSEGIAHSLSPPHHSSPLHESSPQPRKISKGQARKDKRAAEEEAMREQARQEVANNKEADPGELEKQAFERICKDNALTMVEMPPDGHCLFSAVADQLNLLHPKPDNKYDYHETRSAAAAYMRQHPDDFMPYLTVEDVGESGDDVLDNVKFAKYCDQIEQTGEWGGQTEILALSHSFTMPIDVYEAQGPIVKNGEAYASQGPVARISYHQSSYGLGQHYNSLHPAKKIATG